MRASNIMAAGLSSLKAQSITGGSDVDMAVTATGTSSSSDSYGLRSVITKITGGGATAGVRLPAMMDIGDEYMVINYSGSTKLIYPPSGGSINNTTADSAVSLNDKDIAIFKAISSINAAAIVMPGVSEALYLDGITPGTVAASKAIVVDANKDIGSFRNVTASGNVTSAFTNEGVATGLTAAGTTSADAITLTKAYNVITAAAAGTGALLPAAATVGIGGRVVIFNAGANAIKVYAAADTIDGTTGTTGVTLTNAKRCEYIVTAANIYISAQLGATSA